MSDNERLRHLEMLERPPCVVGTLDGLTYAMANLAAGVTTDGAIYLAPGNYPVNANYTIPANVHLVIPKGSYFTVAMGVILTVDGTVEAGLYQIFVYVGTGAVSFTRVKEVYPQWWGAIGDGVTDATAAFEAAGASFSGTLGVSAIGGTVRIASGTYVINDWNPTDEIVYRGSGMEATILKGTTSHVITNPAARPWGLRHAVFEHLGFQPYNSGSYACVYTEPSGGGIHNVTFRNVRFDAPGKYGCYGYFILCTFDNCFFGNTDSGQKLISGIWLGGVGSACNDNIITGCTFYYMSGWAIDIHGGVGGVDDGRFQRIRDCTFEDLDGGAIYIRGGYATIVDGCYFEDLNKISNADNCVFYVDEYNLGPSIFDHNHFTGNNINFTTTIIKESSIQQPRISLSFNYFGAAWSPIEMITSLDAQYRFWFLGNRYSGTPTFGGDSGYRYYNDQTITNFTAQETWPGTITLSGTWLYKSVLTNIGQVAATITWTLPAAAEGYMFTAMIGVVPPTRLHIKAAATDRIYLDGTALDDGDKVSCPFAAAVGDCIRFWTFRTGVATYDWFAETVSGVWVDGGP